MSTKQIGIDVTTSTSEAICGFFHAVQPHLDDVQGAFIATVSVASIKPSGSSLLRPFILDIASDAGDTDAIYPSAVTKAALIHLAKSLAVIAAPRVQVNTVSPGVLLTGWVLIFLEEAGCCAAKQSPEDVRDRRCTCSD